MMEAETFYVYVTDCEGRIAKLCGKPLAGIKTECSHVEIKVPPGCYSVFASHSPQGKGIPPFGNRLTHVQVVRVNCGDHACVTLFSPTLWYCGSWFVHAVRTQLEGLQNAHVNPELARAAVAAVDKLLQALPGDDPYAKNTLQLLQEPPK
jgi:hypothetical protein